MGKLYQKISDHITDNMTGAVLEIGMERGEGSTKFFETLAHRRGVQYVGVDIEPRLTTGEFHQMPGEQYLQTTTKTFSIVYLDNFDWNYWKDEHAGPVVRLDAPVYQKHMNQRLTNVNSQKSHLLQAIALTDHLTPEAVIQCDDTWWEPTYMTYMGKCSSAIPYLLSIGFDVVHCEGKGNSPQSTVIMSRHDTE